MAIGTSTYFDAFGEVERVFNNVFVLRFDEEGRCSDFAGVVREAPVGF